MNEYIRNNTLKLRITSMSLTYQIVSHDIKSFHSYYKTFCNCKKYIIIRKEVWTRLDKLYFKCLDMYIYQYAVLLN